MADSPQSQDKFQQKLAHVAENEITSEKLFLAFFGPQNWVEVPVEWMEWNIFHNHKVPVSLQWFHIDTF